MKIPRILIVENGMEIVVSDNSVREPPYFDWQTTNTLGLQLV